MLLLIDNYDSFTYNLYQYLRELGAEVDTHRNDKITLDEIEDMAPDGIVISPGPCTPMEAGISNDVIRRFGPRLPTLGVCLGHQCIGYVYGARVDRAGRNPPRQDLHDSPQWRGRTERPAQPLRGHPLSFPSGLPRDGARYALEVTAHSENGLIMGLRHKEHPVEGIQFHPESIMTPDGKALLQNYLDKVAQHGKPEAQ